ncbi:transcriptional regulator [Streptomyces sp. NRRL B-24572]|uniref:ArsR/SmtB family transcription factor n=1 Tax=Streptomyces sp. NRRL B-24572 TaxID=1962156 RepID=UPI000A3CD03B|nr:winged helix-turn-helix domain-containing protein [Streptomyces sp. NRRL B-24572]
MAEHEEQSPEPDAGLATQPDAGLATQPVETLTRTLDPHSLRALAHPLRIQLLRALRRYGPATASQLADRLGESSGATSYHLRQLAAHGFIVDDPTRGKGRERWWKAAHQGTSFDETLHKDPDPEVQGALDVFLHEIATIHTQELSTWVATRHTWDEAWAGASDFSDFKLHLPPERLRELNQKIHALINEYSATADPDAPGAERVRMHLHAFPQHND